MFTVKHFIRGYLLCLSLIILSGFTAVQDAVTKVKSAYIINFLKFIEWPKENPDEIVIGFLGESAVEDFLNSTKSAAEKNINIKINTLHFSSAESVGKINVLYVASIKEFKKSDFLKNKCVQDHVLVITDKSVGMPDFSCINFLLVNNRLKFEINHSNLKSNGLKASAQLLKLSHKR